MADSTMQITVRKLGIPAMQPREMRELELLAMADGARYWHKTFLPEHFTNSAERKYGYMPRVGESGRPSPYGFKRSYTGRKLKLFGHTRPLVWTGESMLRALVPNVRRTRRGAKAVINSPGFNRRPKGGVVNLREEIERVTQAEADQVARVCEEALARRLDLVQSVEITVF